VNPSDNHTKIGNAYYWRGMFLDTFIDELSTWRDAVLDRLLPTFADLERESRNVASAEFTRRGRMPASEESAGDMGDHADLANEEGLAHYERMQGARQGLLNLATAGLYHLYEQQVALLVTKELITLHEERDAKFMTELLKTGAMLRLFANRLKAAGIDHTALPAYAKLDELCLVANVVKHGAGKSAEKLLRQAPLLFVPPILRDDEWTLRNLTRDVGAFRPKPPRRVDRPLAGNDLYVTPEEFQRYADAAIGFWTEFADALIA
jgi:hypothetical protein